MCELFNSAAACTMQGKGALAEEALLRAGLAWGAVELSLRAFAWQRALALAQQAGDERYVDAVLWHRCVCRLEAVAAHVCVHSRL